MKKVLISGILVLGSLVSLGQTAKIQEKVKPITKEEILKLNSDSVETTSVVDVRKFKELLKSLPYQDYVKLTPDMVIEYLIGWVKGGKK